MLAIHSNAVSDWSEWFDIGGIDSSGLRRWANSVGGELFGVSRINGRVWRTSQVVPGESLRWADWEDFSGRSKPDSNSAGCFAATFPRRKSWPQRKDRACHRSKCRWAPGGFRRLAHNSTLLHRWEKFADGSIVVSGRLGKRGAAYPAVITDDEGNLEVFAVDLTTATSSIIGANQPASDWLDWSSLDQASFQYIRAHGKSTKVCPITWSRPLRKRGRFSLVGTRDGWRGLMACPLLPQCQKHAAMKLVHHALCADQSARFDRHRWRGADLFEQRKVFPLRQNQRPVRRHCAGDF